MMTLPSGWTTKAFTESLAPRPSAGLNAESRLPMRSLSTMRNSVADGASRNAPPVGALKAMFTVSLFSVRKSSISGMATRTLVMPAAKVRLEATPV